MSDKLLSSRLDIVGTSVAGNGKEYVAIVEHKTLPFYGVQFHPEKSQFETKNLVLR
jgi:imidazoleglycerol phosphate synthase glutamine amidotransferase subunit HisH